MKLLAQLVDKTRQIGHAGGEAEQVGVRTRKQCGDILLGEVARVNTVDIGDALDAGAGVVGECEQPATEASQKADAGLIEDCGRIVLGNQREAVADMVVEPASPATNADLPLRWHRADGFAGLAAAIVLDQAC
ncbi:hypothetical protein BjapCC829_08120 [Bradyrhizobium barranii]|uniref:Uncharacterized protein n=1 Tax=Bradyrhizobium barranii TaxID=2992140 RepID=A0ABY3QR53_9BRAD|nr:hypothetical protein [Bradyrhizobium japonicum]UFW88458.1 hypothetical protein BjapCC829_08120 [Bradyrhizobium japonicum]